MLKKFLVAMIALSFIVVGCTNDTKEEKEIALITDEGDINDKSFNQSTWEAVQAFGKKEKLTYRYYMPKTIDTKGYMDEIETAIENGAKILVCPGYKFDEAIGKAQDLYKDVKFIMIDAAPKVNGEKVVGENVFSITYPEQQPGYLAGYAAVKEGMRKLGFMGGIAVPSVINYGYGYVQGARDAAQEMGVQVEIRYTYTNTFLASSKIQSLATSWYEDGVEVIFSCGGKISDSIFKAAEAMDKKTIGVDVDQKDISKTVITSAVKDIYKSVYDSLKAYKNNTFKAGETLFDAKKNYVGLAKDFSRFEVFTKEEYEILFEKIKEGTLKIQGVSDMQSSENGDPSIFATTEMKILFESE